MHSISCDFWSQVLCYVQNPFLMIWFDSYLHSSSCDVWSHGLCSICSKSIFFNVLIWFMYMLYQFIQVLNGLAHENWVWMIYSEFFDTYQSSSDLNHRLYDSYQYLSGIHWFEPKIVWYLSIFMTTLISHFTLLNQFNILMIRNNPFFSVIMGPNYSYLAPLYILLLTHFSTHFINCNYYSRVFKPLSPLVLQSKHFF